VYQIRREKGKGLKSSLEIKRDKWVRWREIVEFKLFILFSIKKSYIESMQVEEIEKGFFKLKLADKECDINFLC